MTSTCSRPGASTWGTENNLKILQSIYEEVRQGVELRFRTAVTKIENLGKEGYRLITDKGDEVDCTWLIAGPGRSGAEWFSNQCKELGIQLINNQVDIGVRVELPAKVFDTYRRGVQFQLVYPHQAVRRPGAHLLHEPLRPRSGRERGGHEPVSRLLLRSKLRSENTNFACWCPTASPPPSTSPTATESTSPPSATCWPAACWCSASAMVSGIRTNEHRMSKSFVHPTLTAAVPGDLSLALPKRQLDDMIEMEYYQLDKLAPGRRRLSDTLLYSTEVKISLRPAGPVQRAGDRPARLLRRGRRRGRDERIGPGGGVGGEGGPGDFGAAEVSPAGAPPNSECLNNVRSSAAPSLRGRAPPFCTPLPPVHRMA